MAVTLYDLIPSGENFCSDVLLGRFLDYTESRRLQLYPAQESAILELFEEKNVSLNTPTGSGKSLVAVNGPFNPNSEAAGSGAGFQPVSAGILPVMIWSENSAVACQHLRGLEARSDRLEACPTTDKCNPTSEFEFKTISP